MKVGSAPSYPCGTMDPIKDIAALADRKKLLCHVDACYGGFVIPWLEKIGRVSLSLMTHRVFPGRGHPTLPACSLLSVLNAASA